MTRAGSAEYRRVFDAHLIDGESRGVAGVIEDAISASTYLGRDGMTVHTNPYQAAREYVNGASALVYDYDIRGLWEDIGLGVSYERLSESRAFDVYVSQVGDFLARHGYVAAARAERERLAAKRAESDR